MERNEEKADWYWWKGTCCFSLVSAHKSVSFLVIPPDSQWRRSSATRQQHEEKPIGRGGLKSDSFKSCARAGSVGHAAGKHLE